MGICYSSINGKRKTEWESGNDKADSKLKKSGSGDFATFISKLSGGGAAASAAVVAEERALQQIPGRLFSNGASRIASLHTQQGKKGTNQDAMIFWENFYTGSDTNATFCGVFDGHGPYGHMVARKVRDALPILLRSNWESKREIGQNHAHENINFEGMRRFDEFMDEDGCESVEAEDTEKVPDMHIPLKKSIRKAFKLMDKELKLHPSIDCFCSGTTAVALIKQGQDLIIGNIGDSRAVLATRDKDNALVAVQLTVDLKPNLPREAARIQKCKGRVFALQDEPEVARVWLPNSDSPGLAMARAFGDFCLKDFGLISIPDVYHHHITGRDEFVILATDGVWDVLSNKEAVDIVASAPGRGTAARALVDCATRAWRLKYPTSKNDDCAVVCLFLEHMFVANVPKSQNNVANISQTQNADQEEENMVSEGEMEKPYSDVNPENQNKAMEKASSEVDSENQNKALEKASSEVDSENQNKATKKSSEMDSENQNKATEKASSEVDSENQNKEMEKASSEVDSKSQNIIHPITSQGTTKESSEIVPVVDEVEEKPIETTLGQSKRSLAECLSTAEDDEWTALEGITRVNSLLSLPRFLSFDKRSTSWRKWL